MPGIIVPEPLQEQRIRLSCQQSLRVLGLGLANIAAQRAAYSADTQRRKRWQGRLSGVHLAVRKPEALPARRAGAQVFVTAQDLRSVSTQRVRHCSICTRKSCPWAGTLFEM